MEYRRTLQPNLGGLEDKVLSVNRIAKKIRSDKLNKVLNRDKKSFMEISGTNYS